MKRMNPKPRRRYRSRPRWANPPRLDPHPDSAAGRRQRMPRAFARKATDVYSNARLERSPSSGFLSGRGLIARLVSKILFAPPKTKKPPDVPRTFTVDTGQCRSE